MNVRCASCGWTAVSTNAATASAIASQIGAEHLRDCPKRDDLTLAPWWTRWWDEGSAEQGTLEVGWQPLSTNEPYEVPTFAINGMAPTTLRIAPTRRFRFTPMCDHDVIGYRGDTISEERRRPSYEFHQLGCPRTSDCTCGLEATQ